MKKIYSIFAALAAVCLFSACSGGENTFLTETTVSETSAETETTTAAETLTVTEKTTITETTTAETTTSVPLNYTLSCAERSVGASEEQNKLYEFFEENSDNAELGKNIDDSRAQMSENDSYILPENYEICSEEFFADFDGDGNGELYVGRTANLYPQNPWAVYHELWYTDGESCIPVYSNIGRGLFGGVTKPRDGIPLMHIITDVSMGSPVQPANAYYIKDGKPVLYELPKGERFISDSERLFILPAGSEYNELADALSEADYDSESLQAIGWVDGELKIISGYGAENT